MPHQVSVNEAGPNGGRNNNQSRSIDIVPNECPICRVKIAAECFSQGFEFNNILEMYYRCANSKCYRSFIALYRLDQGQTKAQNSRHYSLERCLPREPHEKAVSPVITDISPSFVKIFAQAQTAEDHGLDEVAGPGFRKALEYLIKDYAISLATDEESKNDIRKIQLQPVIKKYLSGKNLSIVSTRAAWLGNDETHYERRWVGKDLKDLKKLIEAVEHFIAMEHLASTIPIEMPDPKAPL